MSGFFASLSKLSSASYVIKFTVCWTVVIFSCGLFIARKLDYTKIRLQIDPRKPVRNVDVITDIIIHMKNTWFKWNKCNTGAKSVTVQTTHRNYSCATCRATLFRCKFLSMFPVFHTAYTTCSATKTFVADWRKLLRKVERGSTLSNKFWLCCSFFIKLTTCRATNLVVP